MARLIIPVTNLPAPNERGKHLIRFRVSSEDRNSISEWSKLFEIESTGQIYPQESVYVVNTSGSTSLNISWETPSLYNIVSASIGASVLHNHGSEWKQHDADVFVSFNNSASSNFIYFGRASDNTFTVIFEEYIQRYSSNTTIEELEDIRIVVQAASFPPKINSIFEFIDTGTVSLI